MTSPGLLWTKGSMCAAYTHYWSRRDDVEKGWPRLVHVAGNRFGRCGVGPGDRIYAVTIRNGEAFLIGVMTVELGPISFAAARKELKKRDYLKYRPWEASDHLIAAQGTEWKVNFGRKIPMEVWSELEFFDSRGIRRRLKFDEATSRLDPQTLRGVRKLTDASARELDEVRWK